MADTPALKELLAEVRDVAGTDDIDGIGYLADRAPRLAAIVRVLVDALRESVAAGDEMFDAYAASDGGLSIDTTTRQLGAIKDGRTALARAEAIAKGEA